MKPLRLFVILVLLTASALVIVYLNIANVQTAHRIQELHERRWELLRQAGEQRVRIAQQTSLPQILKSAGQPGAGLGPKPAAHTTPPAAHAEEHD